MKTKYYLLMMLIVIFWINCYPEEVPLEVAKTVAKNAFFEKAADKISLAYKDIVPETETVIVNDGIPLIYIFNISTDKGFVIVSAQDNVYPLLGFSYEGTYDTDLSVMPDNFAAWMENNQDQMIYAVENSLEPTPEITIYWKHYASENFVPSFAENEILPLIATKWGQGVPYNTYCPADPNATGSGGHCLVGCLATAMAQIMKYWGYPINGDGEYSYYHNKYGLLSATFSSSTYNWKNMPNQYTDPNKEIAKISYHAGVSVQTNYGCQESTAFTSSIEPAFENYFKYDNSLTFKWRSEFPNPGDWETLLKSELDEKRPLIYYGNFNGGGHFFILDGYISVDFFHFNWGWYGNWDGYYLISNLNPGINNYSSTQGAAFEIKPKNDFLKVIQPSIFEFVDINSLYTIKWQSSNFTEQVKIELLKGESVLATLFNSTANDGNEVWDIDNTPTGYIPPLGDDYKIRITQIGGDNLTDESDIDFEITDFPDIEILSPYSAQTWTVGCSYPVVWESAIPGGNLQIDLCDGVAVIETLKPSTPDDGYEICQIPTAIPSGSSYKIKITKVVGTTYVDYSSNFTLEQPYITIKSPKLDDKWLKGRKQKISWNSNFPEKVTIQYAKSPTYSPWENIVVNTPNLSFYDWEIPTVFSSGDYKIKITRAGTIATTKTSDIFIIEEPNISVSQPISGTYNSGDQCTIEWVDNIQENVKVELFKGVNWVRTLNNSTSSDGSLWCFFPLILDFGNDYNIKITSTHDNTLSDIGGNFTINAIALKTWTGAENNEWAADGNWAPNGVPTASDKIVIPSTGKNPCLDNIATIDAIYIYPNATLTINPNGGLTVIHTISVDGDLLIDSDETGASGSIIHNFNWAGSTGNVTFKRSIKTTYPNGDNKGWHLISSPVINGFDTHDLLDYFVNDWIESSNTWIQLEGNNNCNPYPKQSFPVMKGISVKFDESYNCPSNPGTGKDIEFHDFFENLNWGEKSIIFTATNFSGGGPNDNWNLMGNPYPSAIDCSAIVFPAGLDNSIYYYNNNTLNYDTWAGGVGKPQIPPTQGFFVHANAIGILTFNNSMRTHSGANHFYKQEIENLLSVKAKGNGFSDKSYIRFLDEATTSFDSKWDAYKLLSGVPEVPQIYTSTGSEILSINSMPSTEMSVLYFEAGEPGIYSLEVAEANDFDVVILEDRYSGIRTDLLAHPYSFYHYVDMDKDRFLLHFKDVPLTNSREGMIIYSENHHVIIINTDNLDGDIYIYNLMGQVIHRSGLEPGWNNISIDDSQGIYIVKVKTVEKTCTQKVHIR